jgi:hypothetical protein
MRIDNTSTIELQATRIQENMVYLANENGLEYMRLCRNELGQSTQGQGEQGYSLERQIHFPTNWRNRSGLAAARVGWIKDERFRIDAPEHA